MAKLPFMKFYPYDWMNDTRSLSAEAKGCWIELISLMWNGTDRGRWTGTYEEFARVCGCAWESAPRLVSELKKVASVTESNNEVTLINRRIIKEETRYVSGAIRQKNYRDKRKRNAIVTDQTLDVRRQTLDVRQRQETEKRERAPQKSFIKPTVEEIQHYATAQGLLLDAQHFWDHYEANGWRVGRNPMRDWKATVRTWMRSEFRKESPHEPHGSESIFKQAADRRAAIEAQELRKKELASG